MKRANQDPTSQLTSTAEPAAAALQDSNQANPAAVPRTYGGRLSGSGRIGHSLSRRHVSGTCVPPPRAGVRGQPLISMNPGPYDGSLRVQSTHSTCCILEPGVNSKVKMPRRQSCHLKSCSRARHFCRFFHDGASAGTGECWRPLSSVEGGPGGLLSAVTHSKVQ